MLIRLGCQQAFGEVAIGRMSVRRSDHFLSVATTSTMLSRITFVLKQPVPGHNRARWSSQSITQRSGQAGNVPLTSADPETGPREVIDERRRGRWGGHGNRLR